MLNIFNFLWLKASLNAGDFSVIEELVDEFSEESSDEEVDNSLSQSMSENHKFEEDTIIYYLSSDSESNVEAELENCLDDYLNNCRFCLKPFKNDEENLEVTEVTEIIFNEFTSNSVGNTFNIINFICGLKSTLIFFLAHNF